MTLDELRIEAERLGYTLRKNTPFVKFSQCVCGKNSHQLCSVKLADNDRKYYFTCTKCGRQSIKHLGSTEREAKIGWNLAVREWEKQIKNLKTE